MGPDTALATEMLIAPLCLRLLITPEPFDAELPQRIVDFVLAGLQASAVP